MKIVILHGQMHKGSTYNITKIFVDNLRDENTEVVEFFMPKDTPGFCVGCFNCFSKGEEYCPQVDRVRPIVEELDEADLIILQSPCYVYGMSGQLKTLLDHLGYRWMAHRPSQTMFNKVGLVVSTAAGAGTKKVNKSLSNNLFFWGVGRIFSYGKNVAASSWETVDKKKKQKIEKEVHRLSKRISKFVGRRRPSIKTKAMFMAMRGMHKINDWSPLDREYWFNKGWLDKKRPWKETT